MKTNQLNYSTPQSEVVELKTNGILCQSPGGEGGGSEEYGQGGEA